jgi:ADP-ribose pyrophosphatase
VGSAERARSRAGCGDGSRACGLGGACARVGSDGSARAGSCAGPVTAVDGILVDSDERAGEGGFLAIRRLHLRNAHRDGTTSEPYLCDLIARPYGQDAVVVAIYARDAAGVRVLVRQCLRPAIALGRNAAAAPLPEPEPALFQTELVAGIIEVGDRGEAGLRTRAAHEVREEAGFAVEPSAIALLGAGMLPSPGAMVEKFYFAAVEVDPAAQGALAGDGSPMEEGATTRWLGLDEAIAACVRGELPDLKTELGLRRLRDHLAGAE